MASFKDVVEWVSVGMDALGVVVLIVGVGVASWRGLRQERGGRYREVRQGVGRAILLALEFLVAADIIRTVAVRPTMEGVLVLGVVVLIRIVLSFSLEVELEGRWPWQRDRLHGGN